MAQVFPPVRMAGLDMAFADVALAKQLVAILAGLEGPCGALRNQLVVPAEGPPWVRYVLFHGERGIALLDLAPARPRRGIAPLRAFLAEAGFASRYPGELPIVAIELSPETIPRVGTLIAEAFAAAPPCTIRDAGWCEAVNRLLMTAEGLTMARVMPAPAAASSGPLRLAQARQSAAAARAIPLLQKSTPGRPFLLKPISERPPPGRALPQRDLPGKRPLPQTPILEKPILEPALPAQTISKRLESGTGIPIAPAKLPHGRFSEKFPRPSRAIAGLSAAALAVVALTYLFDMFSPAIQAPATGSVETAGNPAPLPRVIEPVGPSSDSVPRMAVDVAPPASAIAGPPPVFVDAPSAILPTTATPTEPDVASEEGVVAPVHLVDVPEAPPSISDGTATVLPPTAVRSAAAMERDSKLPSSGTALNASSPAAGKAPVWDSPLRTAARISPTTSAVKPEPVWYGAPPDFARRQFSQNLVIAKRKNLVSASPIRDTR